MTNIKKLLGSNIKNSRVSLGLSQARLAETIGIATNYLGLIEGGKKFPSAEVIERIAAALGKDPSDLFSTAPLQHEWKSDILSLLDSVITDELKKLKPR